jgi:hypothetical protein
MGPNQRENARGSGWQQQSAQAALPLAQKQDTGTVIGTRGGYVLSLVIVPFGSFDVVSLSVFSVFYGLDWVATGPATFALTNQVFGRRDAPVIVSWIFAGHQVGGALAVRCGTLAGDYMLAFLSSGLACFVASLLVLRITRPALVVAPAE